MNSVRETIQEIYKKTAAQDAALTALESSPAYIWTKINLAAYRDILEFFDIPATIRTRIKNTATQPREIKAGIAKIIHETRAFEKAMETKSITLPQATAAAESLNLQAEDVSLAINSLRRKIAELDEFRQRLKTGLNLDHLLRLTASRLNGSRHETFTLGEETFRILTEVADEQDDTPNLSRIYDKISTLINRISSLPPPELPGLAARVFDHMVKRIINAAHGLQGHIRAILTLSGEEMANVRAIGDECGRKAESSIRDQLDFAADSTAALEKAMAALAEHDEIDPLLHTVIMLVTQLEFFANCVNKDIDARLTARTIDPARFAAAKTKTFFNGINGLWRLLRLAMARISTHGRVPSPAEISAGIEKLIRDCPVFHGGRPEDIESLRLVIENTIGNCDRPFPRNDLIRLGKTAIMEYGDYCEASFAAIPLSGDIPVPMGVKKPRPELGVLVALFEKGTMALGKNIPG